MMIMTKKPEFSAWGRCSVVYVRWMVGVIYVSRTDFSAASRDMVSTFAPPVREPPLWCECLFLGSDSGRGGGDKCLGVMLCDECLVSPACDVCRATIDNAVAAAVPTKLLVPHSPQAIIGPPAMCCHISRRDASVIICDQSIIPLSLCLR